MPPLQGLVSLFVPKPRAALRGFRRYALPWADLWLPLRSEEEAIIRARVAPPNLSGWVAQRKIVPSAWQFHTNRTPMKRRPVPSAPGQLNWPGHPPNHAKRPNAPEGANDKPARAKRPTGAPPWETGFQYMPSPVGAKQPVRAPCATPSGLVSLLSPNPGRRYAAVAATLCPGLICGCPFGAKRRQPSPARVARPTCRLGRAATRCLPISVRSTRFVRP